MHICRNNQYPARGRKPKHVGAVHRDNETINTPPGDGNPVQRYDKENNRRNNQYPARGRKRCWAIHPVKQLLKQSIPRQGTETRLALSANRLSVRNNQYPARGRKRGLGVLLVGVFIETINTPPGDGNIVPIIITRPTGNNQYPARGRKLPEYYISRGLRGNNQYPARGRKRVAFFTGKTRTYETINTPPGDGTCPTYCLK